MPLQNRVDPFGQIIRTAERGTMMGNRGGALHNEQREIVRQYKSRRWIACVLEFKGRKRTVMAPNRYTELFFLDEAVALASGHRPCAECRRKQFQEFRAAWSRQSGRLQGADEMDRELHRARVRKGAKVTYEAELDSLPNGSFVEMEGSAWLVWDDGLLLWTPGAYKARRPRLHGLNVTVLTPQPIVYCLAAGYVPEIHPSRHVL